MNDDGRWAFIESFKYRPEIERIFKDVYKCNIELKKPTEEQDMCEATDYFIKIEDKTFSLGFRVLSLIKMYSNHRVTFRKTVNKKLTEWRKINELKKPQLYLWGYGDKEIPPRHIINRYILVDMDIFRDSGIIEKVNKRISSYTKFNKIDNTDYISLPWNELCEFIPLHPDLKCVISTDIPIVKDLLKTADDKKEKCEKEYFFN